jgi:DNA-binding NarL/FixJ family response regulator
MSLPRVILADDHTILVEAFIKLLEPRCEVVATVSDGRALLDVAYLLRPDVILADIAMPLLNGLEAGRQLKEKMPAVKIIFLTMNEDPDMAAEAMHAGASGYVLKKSAASELFRAIQDAVEGRRYVTPQIARAIRKVSVQNLKPKRQPQALTFRQREVVQLLAEGRSMKEAGAILNLTARTIAFHKYSAMKGLKLNTTADLIQFAIRSRLIQA